MIQTSEEHIDLEENIYIYTYISKLLYFSFLFLLFDSHIQNALVA